MGNKEPPSAVTLLSSNAETLNDRVGGGRRERPSALTTPAKPTRPIEISANSSKAVVSGMAGDDTYLASIARLRSVADSFGLAFRILYLLQQNIRALNSSRHVCGL